jgi:tetratricopeptide (TPR) repeat protein
MKNLFSQTILIILAYLLFITNAFGNVGDIGDVIDECKSSNLRLKGLCEVTSKEFGSPSGEYVHLGDDVYAVIVSGFAHIQNGIYVANVKSKRIAQFGGYAETEILEVTEAANGSIWIRVKQFDMTHGNMYEGETLLERRVNPITRTPFLIEHSIWGKNSLSEERASYCSKKKNRKKSECAGLGKTVYLSENDIRHLLKKSDSLSRDQVDKIIDAHGKALRIDKNMQFEAFGLLEQAGIRWIWDVKPKHMTMSQYVQIMNDYAFWAYQYGEGRNELAIEILYKVIQLSPDRAAAYLNMADALEYSIKYASTPLDNKSMDMLKKSAKIYREKYNRIVQ